MWPQVHPQGYYHPDDEGSSPGSDLKVTTRILNLRGSQCSESSRGVK